MIITISENNYLRFSKVEKEGVIIVKSPDLLKGRLRTGWDLWDTALRIIYLVRKEFDIIHCVDTRPNVVLPCLALKLILGKAKVIMDWGDWWGRGGTICERSKSSVLEKMFAPIETLFEERFRKYADGTVVLTEALRKRSLRLGIAENTIIKIPHGADIVNITPRDTHAARKRLNIDLGRKVLGYVGNIFPSDAELLSSSFEIINSRTSSVQLLIIGNCKAQFKQQFLQTGKIIKTGRVDFDQLMDYIAACDIMLLPLRNSVANNGRWPSKICDYLAAGKPVVSTKVGDIPMLFKDNLGGYLSNAEAGDFASKVLMMLDQDCLIEHGRKAREIAERELDWNVLTGRLENFYRYLLRNY